MYSLVLVVPNAKDQYNVGTSTNLHMMLPYEYIKVDATFKKHVYIKYKKLYRNISRNNVSVCWIPRTRSHINKLWMRIASTSVEMLSSSANVVNSVEFPYAIRIGISGFFSVKYKIFEKCI